VQAGQSVLRGGVDDVAPLGSSLHFRHRGHRVDLDLSHGLERDQDGRGEVVLDQRAGVVTRAHRGDLEPELSRRCDDG
jgi:hypothetical protein